MFNFLNDAKALESVKNFFRFINSLRHSEIELIHLEILVKHFAMSSVKAFKVPVN